MAGECRLEATRNREQSAEGRPLIDSIAPQQRTFAPAEAGSEAQRLGQFMSQYVGVDVMPGQPGNSAWTNLRAIQSLMTAEGFQFREGFPTSGAVSAEMIERIMGGATNGNNRIIPLRDTANLREGDIVFSAAPQSRINVDTCGMRASLGVVMADGRVAKWNGDRHAIVAATEFFNQSDVRAMRVVSNR